MIKIKIQWNVSKLKIVKLNTQTYKSGLTCKVYVNLTHTSIQGSDSVHSLMQVFEQHPNTIDRLS